MPGPACGYVDQAFDFGEDRVRDGLPGFVQSYFKDLATGCDGPTPPSRSLIIPTHFAAVLAVPGISGYCYRIRAFDPGGRLLFDAAVDPGSTSVNTTAWRHGLYLLQVLDRHGAVIAAGKALKE